MDLTTTIYCLKDPLSGDVRYVGKANDLAARIRSHKWEAKHGRLQTYKNRWLRSLGCDPVVEILEVVPRESWAERERFWIKRFRDEGARLTNFADGGQTSPVEGRGHTDETKAKLRELALARGAKPPSQKNATPWNKGTKGVMKPQSTSFRKGYTPWNKGKTMPPELVEKNRQARIGRPWSEARRAAQNKKSVKSTTMKEN